MYILVEKTDTLCIF